MKPLEKECHTFEEWLSWDEDIRAELHDGTLVMMAPPSLRHQKVLMELAAQLHALEPL